MNKNIIVQEGYKPVIIALVITFIMYAIDLELLGALGFVVTLLLLYVYRDTARYIFENPSNILSPVDGKVIAIDKENDKTKLYVQVSLLNNHNIRAPFSSTCKIKNKQHGINLDPSTLKGTMLNEQVKLKFTSHNYEEKAIKMKLISGFFNPTIELQDKETYEQGDKVGFFIHGIAVITLKDTETLVSINDKLKAGQTIISQFD